MISLHKSTEPFEFDDSNWFGYEKPSVLEAFRVLSKEGYYITISGHDYDMRKKRLEKEYEKNHIKCGNPIPCSPALAESASQFNDALLDEQGKKIAELTEEKERLEDKITIFNIFKKRNDEAYRRQIRSLDKEISKLNGIIHDKNAVLSDVAEELRLLKIREKNLTDVSQKYMKENDELKKELDEANKHQQQAYRSCADKNKEIRALKLQISALEKRGNGIDWKRNADAIKLYVNRASHERLWSPISQDICNEQELSFIINHGGKRVKYALRFDGTDIVYECSDPDKKPSFFRDDSVGAVSNQKDCSPANCNRETKKEINDIARGKTKVVGVDISEEGEDYYGKIVLCDKICTRKIEEIEIEKAVKLVRKAMKEGHTVTINYKD